MRRLTLMLMGTMALGGSGLFALACSSDPAVVPEGDDDDDGSSSSGGSSGASSSSGGSSSSSGGSSSGGVCTAKLRPDPAKGPFCPFLAAPTAEDPDKKGANCATGQTCCNGRPKDGDNAGFDDSVCADSADDCPDPSSAEEQKEAYECAETDDCVGGGVTGDAGADGGGGGGSKVCCIIPNPKDSASTIGEGPGNFSCNVLKGEYGTRCQTSCGDRERQGCQADSECGGGTCVLANVGVGDRIQMGYCN